MCGMVVRMNPQTDTPVGEAEEQGQTLVPRPTHPPKRSGRIKLWGDGRWMLWVGSALFAAAIYSYFTEKPEQERARSALRDASKARAGLVAVEHFRRDSASAGEYVSRDAGFAIQFPGVGNTYPWGPRNSLAQPHDLAPLIAGYQSSELVLHYVEWERMTFAVAVYDLPERPKDKAGETLFLDSVLARLRSSGYEVTRQEWETFRGHRTVRYECVFHVGNRKGWGSHTAFIAGKRYYNIALAVAVDEKEKAMPIYPAFQSTFRLLE